MDANMANLQQNKTEQSTPYAPFLVCSALFVGFIGILWFKNQKKSKKESLSQDISRNHQIHNDFKQDLHEATESPVEQCVSNTSNGAEQTEVSSPEEEIQEDVKVIDFIY